MIHTSGSVGSDGKTIMWYFIICYTKKSCMMPSMDVRLNRRGAVTYFYKMIQREKKYHTEEKVRPFVPSRPVGYTVCT